MASSINTLDLFGYPAANLAALEWLDTAVFETTLAHTRPIGSLVYRLIVDNAIQSTHISRMTRRENILLVGANQIFLFGRRNGFFFLSLPHTGLRCCGLIALIQQINLHINLHFNLRTKVYFGRRNTI